jgi:hypothetical protein
MFMPVAVLSIVRTLTRPFTSRGWVGEGVEMPTSDVVAYTMELPKEDVPVNLER